MDRSTMGKQQQCRLFGAAGLEPVLLTVTAAALVAGGVGRLAGAPGLADLCWALGTVAAVGPALGWVPADLRRGHAGVDVIAVLALGGPLLVHEYLAGALIALMLTIQHSGQGRPDTQPQEASVRAVAGHRSAPQRTTRPGTRSSAASIASRDIEPWPPGTTNASAATRLPAS
ncbi:hypothetical protein [Streptomyces sp. TLI_185]|uniref:hypothetical protein n=1 Tax=Streptomyces sp. TLI_185 TaxID=2485151 RepID=UPI000FBA9300|nr:hypothetical protein EDD92_0677 [Streptomyces sp. TLI_185]